MENEKEIKELKTNFARELAKLQKPVFHFIIDWYWMPVFPHKCEVENVYKIGYILKFDIGGICVGI